MKPCAFWCAYTWHGPLAFAFIALSIFLIPDGASAERAVEAPLAIKSLLLDGALAGSRLVVVGERGHILISTDGGGTWSSRAISKDDFHLNKLVPAGARRLFIAAEAGVAYRSDDGGETWRALSSPYRGSWFGALALDVDRVLLLGLRGHLFRSEDAGDSWTRVATATTATLTDAVRLKGDVVLITGHEGTLLTSRDDERSVSSVQLPSRRGISAAVALAGGGALLIGEFGVRRLSVPPAE